MVGALELMGLKPQKASGSAKARSRNFKGALNNGLTYDWVTSNTSVNAELRRNLKTLRFRCRDLERNNDYVRAFLGIAQSQVIGAEGVGFQMRSKNPDGSADAFANRVIEEGFREWMRKGICTMDGRQSFQDVQRLFMRSIVRDGEVLVREIRGKQAGNRFGYAIQLMEVDHLDEDDVRSLPRQRKVYMGVETNEWNRPEGFHLWRHHPGDEFIGALRHDKIRIGAREMFHPFIMERPGQVRGVPWIVSAMLRLQMLGGYEEAELVASRVAAAKMGFFTSETGNDYDGDGEDEDGNIQMDTEPGVMEQLPAGVKLEQWKPEHPTTAFDPFVKAMLRGIATSIGLTYPTLSGDLTGVNFSSLRQGALNERDAWRVIQNWVICNFHTRIFESWLEMALSTPGGINLPVSKFEKFNAIKWQPRGWQWVDPQKEASANIDAWESGMKTRTEILAERGRSFEDFLEERMQEEQLADELGVDLPSARPSQPVNGNTPNAEDEED